MKRIIGITLFGLIAMFFLALDLFIWINFTPHNGVSISLGIACGGVSFLTAFSAFLVYKQKSL